MLVHNFLRILQQNQQNPARHAINQHRGRATKLHDQDVPEPHRRHKKLDMDHLNHHEKHPNVLGQQKRRHRQPDRQTVLRRLPQLLQRDLVQPLRRAGCSHAVFGAVLGHSQ